MRAWIAVAALTAVVLSGCASNGGAERAPASIPIGSIDVPEDAVLETVEHGKTLLFEAIQYPFEHTFALPEGVTMVRVVSEPGDDVYTRPYLYNDDTGRRRCNPQSVVGFGQTLTGPNSCSSIAAIDAPGTNWTATATAGSLGGGPATGDVRIEFFNAPVDGVAGRLDLTQLSHATFDIEGTDGFYVESFDGTRLWVEVTLPAGEGPWPTIVAASPYNGQQGRIGDGEGWAEGTPAMWTYWTQDYAKRGYAAINVDVRGFGKSDGCVEIWSLNEQLDQKAIVDWVAKQEWSDGNVGFYGQSYVGTTPVAAAVHRAEALKAIIAVAPVINAYEDWHYGGVPNGESSGSPAAYQVLTDDPTQWAPGVDPAGTPPVDPNDVLFAATNLATIAQYSAKGLCDPTIAAEANDPRAVYNAFYEERDFKRRVKDVDAAVLYTEGFEDANVKSAMIPGWFNALESPKLGVFGHWLHQHPARMDAEVLFLGWMDQYVKGRDLGFGALPPALISAEGDLHRTAEAWPPVDADETHLFADLDGGALGQAGGGTADLLLGAGDPDLLVGGVDVPGGDALVLRSTGLGMTPIVAPRVHLQGTLDGENGFVQARLFEESTAGTRLLTEGKINLALRNGYDRYDPLAPGTTFDAELPLRPTEHVLAQGSTLRLEIMAAGIVTGVAQPQPAMLHLEGSGTYLALPQVPLEEYGAKPWTVLP